MEIRDRQKQNFAFATVPDKDVNNTVWSLWQAPIGELQWRPLEVLEKAPSHIQITIFPLRNSVWPNAWALVETKRQSTGHQLAM